MKNLFILLFIFEITLIARENPFKPTVAYKEELARINEISETQEGNDIRYQQEQQYVNNIYKKMNNLKKEAKNKKDVVTEEKIKKLIKDAQKQTIKETKIMIKKTMVKKPKVREVIYVKPRLDIKYEKKLLPFLEIKYSNDKIHIHSKYKVSKKITLPNKKKIILDFNAKENFYTKRENLKSSNFTKIIVGNHPKEKFFRVVINLTKLPENYQVSYNNSMVSVVKLYK